MIHSDDQILGLRREAEGMVDLLSRHGDDATVKAGRDLVKRLQGAREFALLIDVAEAVVRQVPEDATTRRRYAQGLIETGHAMIAVDILRPLARHIPKTDAEWAEANGLMGRAYKQVYIDAADKTSPAARDALKRAIEAYRLPFRADPGANTWHGVNLVALIVAARRVGLRIAADLDPQMAARSVLAALDGVPAEKHDCWYHATAAEAHLALGDWDRVEGHLREYLSDPGIEAFHVGSTIRQFTEVWNLGADKSRGKPLISMLRAKMMKMPGGSADLSPEMVRELAASSAPAGGQLEAVLGVDGPRTYRWMQAAMERARSVAAIYTKLGERHGTGFLTQARSVGLHGRDELVLVTNHHVVNAEGSGQAIRPDDGRVAFEAVDASGRVCIREVLWSSPQDRLDASILALSQQPVEIEPLQMAMALPVVDESQRVYVIGHPGGRELAFSFQDNKLIDHEGPPNGKPQLPGVVKIHYRAPTEGGSSGSPVFNEMWDAIGLHHFGGKQGVKMLNGKPGTYAANEGIWIQSVATANKA